MIILGIPRSGRDGEFVYYMRGKKLCRRRYFIPTNVRTAARVRARGVLGAITKAWSRVLTEEQRRAWNAAAAKVRSRPRLWQAGWLTGETFFAGINSARSRIGRENLLLWPPEPVVFQPNPIEGLSLGEEQGRLRLKVRVAGPVVGDIMVFGAAPCSAGRKKWRHGAYLGLLPAPVGEESDITELYVARYGEPKAGERVVIRTRQQRDGWEDEDKDISDVVRAEAVVAEIRIPKSEIRNKSKCMEKREGRNGEPQPGQLHRLHELHKLHGLNGLQGLHGLQRGAVAGRVGTRCTREQYRSSSIHTPGQYRTGEGGECRMRSAECGMRNGGEAGGRRKGRWRELWRGT